MGHVCHRERDPNIVILALALTCCTSCICFFLSIIVSSHLPSSEVHGWPVRGLAAEGDSCVFLTLLAQHGLGCRISSYATEPCFLSAVSYQHEHSSMYNIPDLSCGQVLSLAATV